MGNLHLENPAAHAKNIDISPFAKAGENTRQVQVVNTWHNRLVADAGKAENERFSHISQPYRIKPNTPAAASGLLGPVRVMREKAILEAAPGISPAKKIR